MMCIPEYFKIRTSTNKYNYTIYYMLYYTLTLYYYIDVVHAGVCRGVQGCAGVCRGVEIVTQLTDILAYFHPASHILCIQLIFNLPDIH